MKRVISTVLAALVVATGVASAQSEWPDKPVRLVIPFPAGSSADIVARILQQKIGPRLGQQIVIDNRSGASGNIGSDIIAKAAPDGYTFGIATNSTHSVAPSLNPNLPYDPVKDFTLISLIGAAPYVLITAPSLPVNNLAELIALAKSKPGALNYASAGPASLAHLCGALFSQLAGVQLTHVPYRSSAQSVLDTSEGRIEMQFGTFGPVLPHIRAGKVKPLAVTSLKRVGLLPDVPTLDEAGLKGYEASLWMAVVAPAGIPPAIANRMTGLLKEALTMPDVVEALRAQGIEAGPSTPDELKKLIQTDMDKWRKLAAATGISMEGQK